MKLTPCSRNRQRLGVSSAVIESGRRPSMTITMFSAAVPAAAGRPWPAKHRASRMVVKISLENGRRIRHPCYCPVDNSRAELHQEYIAREHPGLRQVSYSAG